MNLRITRRWGAAAVFAFLVGIHANAEIQVTVNGPGGSGQAVLPDEGGAFAVDIPLNRNAVNPFTITAGDSHGNVRSAELAITQLSLDQIVVSEVTAERLSTEEVEQLVADGTIQLDDPENYNVSEFAIVLTIDNQQVPISIPIVFPANVPNPTGSGEVPNPPSDDGSGGRPPPPPPPEIIVFLQEFTPSAPGEPTPPPIPGVIIIEGRIKSLKEFFNVRLLLMNTSGIFTLENVLAELEFPDGGLTHMLPADGLATFGDILPGTPEQPGALEKEFIIRGDEIGVRTVRVNFGGSVAGPGITAGDEIPFNGSAETTVEVKGPPAFQVQVTHPAAVTSGVPYELTVEILNKGELPALYASLELDVSADAKLADCTIDEATGDPVCEYVAEPVVQSLGHIDPGERISVTYTVLPSRSGQITSCMGVSDQNITLQVVVGTIGCVAGHYPPDIGAPDGIPTVTVVPVNNAQGIFIDSPVVAFFSELMNHGSIQTGSNGTFNVVDAAQNIVPGQIRIETNLSNRTMAIWQVNDGVLNRLNPGQEYTVFLSQGIRDRQGNALFNEWVSTFKTTTMGVNDTDPPQLSLSIEPPVNPNYVIPGEVVRVNAYATDQGSGISRVELRLKDLDGTNVLYTLVDQRSVYAGDSPPFLFALDSANLVLGHTVQLLATAYDGMGNARNATLGLIVAPTADPPTIVLPDDPAQPVLQGISVTLKPVALTGGVHEVRYYLDGAAMPFKTLTLPPWQASLSTLTLDLTNHEIQAVAEDGLGQTGSDTFEFNLITNPSLPVVSFPGSMDGEVHIQGDPFSVDPDVSDEVGVRSVGVYLASPATNLISTGIGPVLIQTTNLELGVHHVIVLATNELGKANDPVDPDSFLEFTLIEPPVGTPPEAPTVDNVTIPDGGITTVSGTSSNNARIDIENIDLGVTASVNADGTGAFSAQVTAAGGDTLRVTATDLVHSEDPSPSVDVVVPNPPVLLGIEVRPDSFTLSSEGAHRDLEVWGSYDNGQTNDITSQATFGSDEQGIASVNAAGRVVAVSRGHAVITAQVPGQSDVSSVFVDIVKLTNITVAPPAVALASIGQSQSLSVTGQYNNGTTQPLPTGNSFVSGDATIATVSGGGVVTATGDGLTQVMVYRTGVPSVAVPIQVNTGADPAPVVDILSPPNGSLYEPGGTVAVSVRAQDPTVGVERVYLSVTGAVTHSAFRQLSPAAKDTTQIFNFQVGSAVPVGSVFHALTWAIDTSGNSSATSQVALVVGDASAPAVHIDVPIPGSSYGYGDVLPVHVQVTDASGVTQVWVTTTGALILSETRTLNPAATASNVVFNFAVPFGVPHPDVTIHAEAWDTQGLKGTAITVPITISDADLTPPATEVTAVADPGVGTNATATVTYEVTDGLADLDHVEIYFRRDGYGTFNRYTDADGGNSLGHFFPQSGATGTMTYDSTKMGGDGTCEFYSVGVDQYANRELAPTNASGTVVADQLHAFASIPVWVTIHSNTDIPLGDTTYDNVNLRIDGATVTLDGHHEFHNLELLNGAVLTHPETTGTAEYGIDITAWTVCIDSNSSINVDERGYLGGEQPGNTFSEGRTDGNVAGSTERSGGSYGGLGGVSGGTPNALYGDLTAPADLGSGGSRGGSTAYPGGDGGGRIHLQAINLVNDGVITANGQNGHGNASGSGSGGAVYLVLSTVSGHGILTADGAGYEVGGGGGRIALHYVDIDTLDTALLRALGGQGSVADGGNGTIFLRSVEEGGGTLVVDGQGTGSSFSALPIPPGYVFDNIIIRNTARVVADDELAVSNTIEILTGSIVTHSLTHEDGLRISCARLEIDSSSSIDVSAKGYRGGERDGNTSSEGLTLDEQPGASERSGGSYGGAGGESGGGSNPVYGDPHNPVLLGSGGSRGGSTAYPGGNGGGRVDITATEAVVVEGSIVAGGQNGGGNAAGSGSGGSIKIDTSLLRGTGTIAADGAAHEVGGSGGRVWIGYDYTGQSGDDLDGLRNIHAFGGKGSTAHGGAGTVVLRRHDQALGDLTIDDNVLGSTAAAWTPLPHIGFGESASLGVDTLETDGTVILLPGGLTGLNLNPNTAQGQTFTIVANTATSITVDVSGGTLLTDVAAPGDEYAGVYRFDNVNFRRGGFMVLGDELRITDTLLIDEFGRLTHFDAGSGFESRIDLTVGTLELTTNGFIDADTRGYVGGERPGSGGTSEGHTLDDASGSTERSGGSYGGLGGLTGSGVPNPIYGSLTQPAELGSGGSRGGSTTYPGGDGGGRIHIAAVSMMIDGIISAGGQNGFGNSSGSGSGGCIDIQTGSLAGDGAIRANGAGHEVAGGGGRIAVRYDQLTLPQSHIEARGGQSSVQDGGNGTLFLKQAAQTYGDLIVDGLGLATPADKSIVPGGYTFDNILLRNRADVIADDGLTVAGQLVLQTNSTLHHTLNHEAGLQITAGHVSVDATSSINVGERGYRGGERSGNTHSEGYTLNEQIDSSQRAGGSYGGLGGVSGGRANRVYGDPKNPIHLGSGGTRGGSTAYPGGHGGGHVDMAVAETLVVDGTILANGQNGGGNGAGSGSGGSIKIVAGSLSGTGTIAADGAAHEVGGGGGRVAIAYTSLGGPGQDLDGLRNIHAFGGHGTVAWGSAGTVVLRQSGQTDGDLVVDDNRTGSSSPVWTPLTPISFGTVQAVTADTLTLDGRNPPLSGALTGLTLNPNLTQETTFTIVANTDSAIMVDVSGGTNLTDVAAPGDEYGGVHVFDNVLFRRGGFLVLGDTLQVNDTLRLEEYGRLTHYDATTLFESRLNLRAVNLMIASNAAITVDERGYLGGERLDNPGSYGRTLNNAPGSTERSGGSYGGLGYASGGVPNPVYGSSTNPGDLGSGGSRGGSTTYPGGDGGGRMRISAGTLQVDGLITALGQNGHGNASGSGSGGSIFIETGALSGSGAIRADGAGYEVAGGGGRIAIYYPAGSSDTNLLAITAAGGDGTVGDGAVGTVHLDDTYVYVPFDLGSGGGSGAGASSLRIVSLVRVTEGPAKVHWSDPVRRSASGATYAVEFAPDLLTCTNWIPLDGKWGDGEWEGVLPDNVRNGFIRIRRIP